MKKIFPLLLLSIIVTALQAQMGVGTTTPNSTLDVRGSLSTNYRSFATATASATTTDNTLVFTGATASTLTLPDAISIPGRAYWIKNATSNSSVLTVNTTSSQTIDGFTLWLLTQTNKTVQVISNGANWYVASESLPGGGVTGGTIAWPGTVYSTPTTGIVSGNNITFAPALASQAAYSIFAKGSGAGTPSFLTSIDSNWIPTLHSELYYNTKYWGVSGNGGTLSGTNFLGTTGNTSFKIKTNSVQGILLDSLGNVGIGSAPLFTSSPNREKLLVDAGTNVANDFINVISGKGSTNNYLQVNIQNRSGGVAASSDIVATNNTGTESVNYIDLGINSTGFAAGTITGGANTAYLFATGNDFVIGNNTANKPIRFYTTTPAGTNVEAMRIDSGGNVGIGTPSPAAKLDVAGAYKLGTSGSVLNSMIKTTVTNATNPTVTTATTVITLSVPGAILNASVILNPRNLPSGIAVAYSRVTSANIVDVGLISVGSVALGTVTFDVTIIQ